jgi:hypothetical protein
MSADPPGEPGHVQPLVALGLVTAAFVALVIFGLGMTSLALNADVIAVPGLGQIPGILGTVFATGAFAAVMAIALRRPHPSYWAAPVAAVAVLLGYALGVWIGAVGGGTDLAAATAAVAGVLTSWFGLVIAGAALVCGWGGIALVRTRASRPRWPWEDPYDE